MGYATSSATNNYRCFSVFLCGSQKTGQIDLRLEIKRLINNRFRCEAFLGEDIPEFKDPLLKASSGLDIELRAARKADSILIVLGTPGTIAEVTAFGLDPNIKPKIRVFNDSEFKGATTFVNLAVSNLLEESQIQYVTGLLSGGGLTVDFVKSIDSMLAQQSFNKLVREKRIQTTLGYEQFVIISAICATSPTSYQDLVEITALKEHHFRQALEALFKKDFLIQNSGNKYEPTKLAKDEIPRGVAFDIAAARSAWMFANSR